MALLLLAGGGAALRAPAMGGRATPSVRTPALVPPSSENEWRREMLRLDTCDATRELFSDAPRDPAGVDSTEL